MMSSNKKIDFKKHLLVFLITLSMFGGGFFLSDFLTKQRISELETLQQNLRIDILSLETQFSILAQVPCENLDESSLTKELYEISKKLASVENTLGRNNPVFLRLKKYYSILQIKHWLLFQKAAKECDLNLVSIIYFYSEKKSCPKCQQQGYILTYFRKKYPFLRIYSFDYDLNLSALQALKAVYSLKKELPLIIIRNKVYYHFKDKEELKKILENYFTLEKKENFSSKN